jgi:lipopolysaccharide transport system ATP-binding protein
MKKAEIDGKFDEIVAFSEVEKFIDTPVKRYSSGMYVRLAFAVAAHLEPEILIVDEVLAVGDTEFQKKCLGKMQDVASREGRTVLFVSHNLQAVEHLCSRGLYLESGAVGCDGTQLEALRYYVRRTKATVDGIDLVRRQDRTGSGQVLFTNLSLSNGDGQRVAALRSGEKAIFDLTYRIVSARAPRNDIVASIGIKAGMDGYTILFRSTFSRDALGISSDEGIIRCETPSLPLVNGTYVCDLFLSHDDREILDFVTDAASITVTGGDFFGTGSGGQPTHCKVLTAATWSVL